jgi:hypothetical protein
MERSHPESSGLSGAGEGNRTLTLSLGSSRSATELLPLSGPGPQGITEARALQQFGVGEKRPEIFTPSQPGRISNTLDTGGASSSALVRHTVVFVPQVQALDSDTMDKVLERHGDRMMKDLGRRLRRQNT